MTEAAVGEPLPWYEQIKKGIEKRGQKVAYWEILGEGAVSAVIITDHCIDGRVFLVSSPTNVVPISSRHGWFAQNAQDIFPGLIEYIGPCDGTVDFNNYNLENYECMMNDNRDFLALVRQLRQREREQ